MTEMLDAASRAADPIAFYVDGDWCGGAFHSQAPVYDPATCAAIARVALATEHDVARAIDAARCALPSWRAAGARRRGAVLRRVSQIVAERAEPMALALTSEQGKTLAESRAELARAVDTLAWHADAASEVCAERATGRADARVHPEPLGVVAAFTPWNYPAVIIARKLGAALAAGCTVVLKAAEETPTIAAMLVQCVADALAEAAQPHGVINLLFGDPPAVSAQLLDSPPVRVLSFTGSTAVGKVLAARAAGSLTHCVLELGGHAPAIVCDDADVDEAARAIAAYKFECAGQSCNAPSRIFVHASVFARFVEALAAIACNLRVGDGRDSATEMGPMANPRRIAAMERLVGDAVARGAQVLAGGGRLARQGWFWAPTVLTDVPNDAHLVTEEPFGPIAPVWSFDSLADAVRLANASAHGLAGYVFTRDPDRARDIAAELGVGSVGVNVLRGVPPDVATAGVKDSGYGYEGGPQGIEAFLSLKVVSGYAGNLL